MKVTNWKLLSFCPVSVTGFLVLMSCGGVIADEMASFWGGKVQWAAPTNILVRSGSPTNAVRLGVLFEIDRSDLSRRQAGCHLFLRNDSTNNMMFVLPDEDQLLAISLSDERGNVIRKTSRGKAAGAPLPTTKRADPKKSDKLKRVWLRPKNGTWFLAFNLTDYFKLEKPGKYHLDLEQRLYILTDDWTLKGVILPKAAVEIEIK
ncbi:MAG: hypothetical protein KJ070_25390 [Verrucomicrobia bacterium]|nr:hypothetical protein [Verrucomicrobiota bacterium]